jgi:hypothetical protein
VLLLLATVLGLTRVQLRRRSCGLGETRPTRAAFSVPRLRRSFKTPGASDFADPWNVADVAEELRRTRSSGKPAMTAFFGDGGGPPPSGPPLTSAAAPIPSALLQFCVALRNGKIGFFNQDRIQKFAFDRLVFPDMRDDSIDRHRHLFEREFDRAV